MTTTRHSAKPKPIANFWKRPDELGMLPHSVTQSLADQWNRFHVDPVAYLDGRHALEYLEPQARWTNGCPMGNGDLGVLAYGPPEATMFNFGKTDLWDYTPMAKANFPAVPFAELRAALASQDNERFKHLQALTDKQVTHAVATAKPGGMLRLELFPSAIASQFKQRLSLAQAETVQTWVPCGDRRNRHGGPDNGVTMTSFVHAARNVFAVTVTPGQDVGWHNPIHFSFWREEDTDMDAPVAHVKGNRFWIRQNLPGGVHFILMGAVATPGIAITKSGQRIHGTGVPKESTLTFYVTLVTSKDSQNPLATAHGNIDQALRAGSKSLRQTHRRWWHSFWRRGYVCTPWPQLERSWYYALYLQASCCRPGRLSPGLQSNLIKENYPAWNADFHNNINMQILYWGQYTANRLELGEPLYRLMWDVLPQCKKDTTRYFGMRGARYPIAMGPDGIETAPGILLSTWIGAGGWLAEHFWWHYRFSGDRDFLKKYAYPLLRECALFYEDYLQEDQAGHLELFPTVFMEVAVGAVTGVGKNSSWDLPVVIRTFQMAAEAAETLDVDAKQRTKWHEILQRLPAIPADERGVWLEFADKGGLWHQWDWARFMAIYPMELVSRDAGPAALREQAQRTIEDYYSFRQEKAHEVAGFAGAIQAAALLRMGHIERGVKMAEYVCSQVSPSGFITGREMHCLQVDAPPGYTVFLNEMLLQSHEGVLRVFPAVPPSDAPVCFHSLRAQGGFLVTAERRQNRTQYVIVQSLCGNRLRLLNPFVGEPDLGIQVKVYAVDEHTRLETVADQMQLVPMLDRIVVPGEIIEFPTGKQQVYLISKEIPWFTNIPNREIK